MFRRTIIPVVIVLSSIIVSLTQAKDSMAIEDPFANSERTKNYIYQQEGYHGFLELSPLEMNYFLLKLGTIDDEKGHTCDFDGKCKKLKTGVLMCRDGEEEDETQFVKIEFFDNDDIINVNTTNNHLCGANGDFTGFYKFHGSTYKISLVTIGNKKAVQIPYDTAIIYTKKTYPYPIGDDSTELDVSWISVQPNGVVLSGISHEFGTPPHLDSISIQAKDIIKILCKSNSSLPDKDAYAELRYANGQWQVKYAGENWKVVK